MPYTFTITKRAIQNLDTTRIQPHVDEIIWKAGPLNASVLAVFVNLRVLHCKRNSLTSLAGIEACPRLEILFCYYNSLTSLAGIETCPRLRVLHCHHNQLTSLAGVENCPELLTIECRSNRIASMEHVVYLRNLVTLWYTGNPLEIQSIQVDRFLRQLESRFTYSRGRTAGTVYTDSQNVHNTHVQKTVCESLRRLLTDPKPSFTIADLDGSGLSKRAIKLIHTYCDDSSIHSIHLLTYSELLAYVWARIVKHEHKNELVKILGEQVRDSEDKCFTGRFNRLVSVLAGFCDDIVIEISNRSRIGAIVVAAKYGITPYDSAKHRDTAHTLLTEAGYDTDTIKPWLEAITEA